MDDAEESCVRSDAKCQRGDDDCREPWTLRQRSNRVTEILYQTLDKVYTTFIATLLLPLRNASDGTPRGPAGFLRRHIFNELIEVETKFCVEFEVDIPTPEQRPKPQTRFVNIRMAKPPGSR